MTAEETAQQAFWERRDVRETVDSALAKLAEMAGRQTAFPELFLAGVAYADASSAFFNSVADQPRVLAAARQVLVRGALQALTSAPTTPYHLSNLAPYPPT